MPTQTPTDRFAELRAPTQWQAVDFISDLHLQASDLATFACFERYLRRPQHQRADALFILGDLFEVWVGDDSLNPQPATTDGEFWQRCANVLREYSHHTPIYFMHGNRDFLLGPSAAAACGMQPLPDPTVLDFLDERVVLSHGDAMCLDDTDYQRFRTVVRSPAWQADFLGKPLTERQAVARDMRRQSEARKRAGGKDPSLWADVHASAAHAMLQAAQSNHLIHGHTHRPSEHDLGPATQVDGSTTRLHRTVLSDWEATGSAPRAEVLRLDATGLNRVSVL